MAGDGAYARPHEIRVFLAVGAILVVVGMYIGSPGRKSHALKPNTDPIAASPRLGPGGVPAYLRDPRAGAEHLEALAKSTNGEWDKLSEENKRWLDSVTAGHGPQMLAMSARTLKKKSSKPAAKEPQANIQQSTP